MISSLTASLLVNNCGILIYIIVGGNEYSIATRIVNNKHV